MADIQAVDPNRRSAAVVGHLPVPLEGAAAVDLAGHIYLAGGDSSVSEKARTGAGTTQLSPPRATTSPGLNTVSTIWAFDPVRRRMLVAGHLQVPSRTPAWRYWGAERGWWVAKPVGRSRRSCR